MVGKRTHLQVIPQKSTQNAANLSLQTDMRQKTSELFYCSTLASTLVSVATLLTQVPL